MAEMMARGALGGKRGRRKSRGSRKKRSASTVDNDGDAEAPVSASAPDNSSTPADEAPTENNATAESSAPQVQSDGEDIQETEDQETEEEPTHVGKEKPKEEEQDEEGDADHPDNTPAALQAELEKILQKHDPSKVAHIPRMLASVRSGRVTFASLQKQLENKYGETLTRCSTSPFKSKKSANDSLSKPQLLSIQKQLKQVLFKRMGEAKATPVIKNILRQLQAGSLSFRALTRQFQKRYGEKLTLEDSDGSSGAKTKASKSRLTIAELKSIHAQLKRVVKEKDPSKVSLIRPLMSRLQKGSLSFEQLQVRVETHTHTHNTLIRWLLTYTVLGCEACLDQGFEAD